MRSYASIFFAVASLCLGPSATAKLIKNNADTFGYLQIWNLCPASYPSVKGSIIGPEEKQVLYPLQPGYLSHYAAITPGEYRIDLSTSDGKQTIPTIVFKISKMHWATVILQLDEKGKIVSRVADDTYTFKKTDPGQVTVYNFSPQGQVASAITGTPLQPLTGYGSNYVLSNLTGDSVVINASMFKKGDRRVRSTSLPIPLDNCKRWALVFTMDVDGNIIPNVAPLGYNSSEFAEFVNVADDYPDGPSTPTPTPTPVPQ